MNCPDRSPRAFMVAAGALVILSIVVTWPLAAHMFDAIPFTDRPLEGTDVVDLVEGDHLQLYYHYWLFRDVVFGSTPLFMDPYEFHGDPTWRRTTTQRVPDSALVAFLSVAGMPFGYNAWALISTVLAGLAAYGLARHYRLDPMAALFAGVFYACLPYRIGHLCGGHQTGFALWIYPAAWLAVEKGLASARPWRMTAAAGALIVCGSFTDVQVAFYLILGLGAFTAVRGVQSLTRCDTADDPPAPFPLAYAIAAGAILLALTGMAQTARRVEGAARWVVYCWFAGWGVFAWTTWYGAWARSARVVAIALVALPLAVAAYVPTRSWWVAAMVISLAPLVAVPLVPRGTARDRLRHLGLWAGPLLAGVGLAAVWLLYDLGSAVTETSWRNLRGGEAHLYAPRISDAIVVSADVERRLALGWAALIAGALGWARGLARRRTVGLKEFPFSLWLLLFLVAFALSFGPRFREIAPVYDWATFLVPFYEKSRTTSRVFTVAALAWAMIAAYGVDVLARRRVGRRRRVAVWCLGAVLLIGVVLEFRPPRRVGMCLLPGRPSVYEELEGKKTLALPIWPGDSSPSSVYLYYATLSRALLVNGYSPIVSSRYVDDIFWPLYPADYGEWTPEMGSLLARIGAEYVVLHEDRFPQRLSPFGPGPTVERTFATPVLVHDTSEGPLHRFRVADPAPAAASWSPARSPLGILYEAEAVVGNGGRVIDDPAAWGGRLAGPEESRPDGFYARTPYSGMPAAQYEGLFRMRLRPGASADAPVALLRARTRERILAERYVHARDLPADGGVASLPLVAELPATDGMSWTVSREPGGDVDVDAILVRTLPADSAERFEAEKARYAGHTIRSADASGGAAVQGGGRGYPLHGLLVSGPRRCFEPGRYDARVAARGSGERDSRVQIRAVDVSRSRVLAEAVFDLVPGVAWRVLNLPFRAESDLVLDLEVRYLAGDACAVDWLAVLPAEDAGARGIR